MFNVKKVGIMSSACICNGRRGRLQFERPWRDSTKNGGAVETALASKPWEYSGTRSHVKDSIMGLTGITLNSALKLTVTATSEGLFPPLEGRWCLLCRNYHSIALVLGTIHGTIDCVYLQLPGGNPPLPEVKALQIEQWLILYHMTSVACAFSNARRW